MTAWLTANEPFVRFGASAGVFAVMTIWEILAARRPLRISKTRRWVANLSLVVLNTVLLRLVFPMAAIGIAVLSAEQGWGVLNQIDLPGWAEVLIAVIALDLAIYLQHVMFHAVPRLWRLHLVHHADLDIDVTTGVRFHPVEIVLSMGIKFAMVLVIGPSAVAVILFEVLLNATAMFNHSNVRLPLPIDRLLRRFVVTPDMHRVHHSVVPSESNSNFGFSLPWWDRIFGTYLSQPAAGHLEMSIGVEQIQDTEPQSVSWMLALPFVGDPGAYAINRREWK